VDDRKSPVIEVMSLLCEVMSNVNLVCLPEASPLEDELFSNVGHGWKHVADAHGTESFRKDVVRDFPILIQNVSESQTAYS